MSTRRQIAEGRRGDGPITAGRLIVLADPGTRIQLVVEGVVILTRQVRQHLERHVRRLRQREGNRHLPRGRVRARALALVAAVVRPLNGLAARGRCITHHHEGGEGALTREAF